MHLRTSHALVLLIAVSTAVTLLELPSGTGLTLAALSLAAGVSALTVMGAAALLGGRIKLVESLLGGLDRMYLAHKWLAVFALGLASIHFAFPAARFVADGADRRAAAFPYPACTAAQLSRLDADRDARAEQENSL